MTTGDHALYIVGKYSFAKSFDEVLQPYKYAFGKGGKEDPEYGSKTGQYCGTDNISECAKDEDCGGVMGKGGAFHGFKPQNCNRETASGPGFGCCRPYEEPENLDDRYGGFFNEQPICMQLLENTYKVEEYGNLTCPNGMKGSLYRENNEDPNLCVPDKPDADTRSMYYALNYSGPEDCEWTGSPTGGLCINSANCADDGVCCENEDKIRVCLPRQHHTYVDGETAWVCPCDYWAEDGTKKAIYKQRGAGKSSPDIMEICAYENGKNCVNSDNCKTGVCCEYDFPYKARRCVPRNHHTYADGETAWVCPCMYDGRELIAQHCGGSTCPDPDEYCMAAEDSQCRPGTDCSVEGQKCDDGGAHICINKKWQIRADSCHGSDCDVEGAHCMAGSPGSQFRGFYEDWICENKKWTVIYNKAQQPGAVLPSVS